MEGRTREGGSDNREIQTSDCQPLAAFSTPPNASELTTICGASFEVIGKCFIFSRIQVHPIAKGSDEGRSDRGRMAISTLLGNVDKCSQHLRRIRAGATIASLSGYVRAARHLDEHILCKTMQ